MTDANLLPEEQEPSEEREEQEEHVSMVTHADKAERPTISRPDPEEEPDAWFMPRAAEANLEDVEPDLEEDPDRGDLAEDSRDESIMEDVPADQQQPLNICADAVEDHILVVQTSAEVLKPTGSDSSLQEIDCWAASLETGAANQPDDGGGPRAEQPAAALVWAVDPSAGLKKQESSEAKQLLVHSEEPQVGEPEPLLGPVPAQSGDPRPPGAGSRKPPTLTPAPSLEAHEGLQD